MRRGDGGEGSRGRDGAEGRLGTGRSSMWLIEAGLNWCLGAI